jgi:protein-L-isoaspartate(D-aspartate) O-methyltransferase
LIDATDEAAAVKALTEKHLAIFRRHMVDVITIHADLCERGNWEDRARRRVLDVMRELPRHLFVPAPVAAAAYEDMPLPIGFDKTISQPFMVALMTDLLDPQPGNPILEVGTGLGYQTAILARLAGRVWSIEIVEEFVSAAEARLKLVGIANASLRVGDGSRGWAEHAPFDKILVAAAAKEVPPALMEQLKPNGRLVMPLGPGEAQHLTLVQKGADGVRRRELMPVRFTELEIGA